MRYYVTETQEWQAYPYDAELPPPLCFSLPAGAVLKNNTGRVQIGGAVKASMSQPKLMMDPSDRSTWQRPYRFGATDNIIQPPPRTPGPGTPRLICIPPDAMT
jgi:hypothetical protein